MNPSMEKRFEYWNHFIAMHFVEKIGGGKGITGPRLVKIKPFVLANNNFWSDVINRHNGENQTPEQMKENNRENYDHCFGNFWGRIREVIIK